MTPTIIARMSALTLCISLVAGAVATATAAEGLTCPREIPGDLLRELWNRTNVLINRLPKEESLSRRTRLLPKFCTKCSERLIGWLELQEMIDIYQRSVFSTAVIQKLLPQHYDELLYRLHHTLQHCVSSGHSKHLKVLKKMERKIKKKRDEGALKAVSEFSFILRWIDELI